MPDFIIDPISVPDVQAEGTQEETAISTLGNAYLLYAVSYDYSDTVPAGEVISQSPAPATEVEANSTVTIVVSLGIGGGLIGFGAGLIKLRRRRRHRARRFRKVVYQ